jgi:hypothetical protein
MSQYELILKLHLQIPMIYREIDYALVVGTEPVIFRNSRTIQHIWGLSRDKKTCSFFSITLNITLSMPLKQTKLLGTY